MYNKSMISNTKHNFWNNERPAYEVKRSTKNAPKQATFKYSTLFREGVSLVSSPYGEGNLSFDCQFSQPTVSVYVYL